MAIQDSLVILFATNDRKVVCFLFRRRLVFLRYVVVPIQSNPASHFFVLLIAAAVAQHVVQPVPSRVLIRPTLHGPGTNDGGGGSTMLGQQRRVSGGIESEISIIIDIQDDVNSV